MKTGIKVSGRLIAPDLSQKFLKALKENIQDGVDKVRENIIKRTRSGRSFTGSPFRAYTEKYKTKRAKAGLQTSPVNLTVTGELLDTISAKVKRSGDTISGEIKVADSQKQKAEGLQTRHSRNPNPRPFMGLTKDDEKIIIDAMTNTKLEELNP